MSFKFALSENVKVPDSIQSGTVIRRTESIQDEPNYVVHYQDRGERQVGWFTEAFLAAANR